MMQDVVLDEDDAASGAGPADLRVAAVTVARWGRTHTAASSVVLAALVAVVLVVLVGLPRWSLARERALLTAPARVAGAVHPLPEPPVVGWSVRGPWSPRAALAGDTVVIYDGDPARTTVTGVDLVTGAERWATTLPEAAGGSRRRCLPVNGAPEAVPAVVCLHEVERPDASRTPEPGLLVVLDARDGSELDRREVAGALPGAQVVGQDLLVPVLVDDGVDLVRQDARTGAERWRIEVLGTLANGVPQRVDLTVREGVLLVLAAGVAMVLEAGTGAQVRAVEPGNRPRDSVGLLRDGSVLVGAYGSGDAALMIRTTVYGPDGGVQFTTRGTLSEPLVTDAPAEHLFAWSTLSGSPFGGRVRAVSRVTGEELWRSPGPSAGVLLELDGVAVLHGAGFAVGVDARDGNQLWRRHVTLTSSERPLTDGTRLLIARVEPGEGAVLEALRLADGSTAWEVPLPAGVTRVDQLGPHLVGIGPTLVVALR
jgi:outer membrane protein assembly factor BamB